MSCEKFIGNLFLARDVTHSVHLNTRSYAKHKALNKFYVSIIELADDFAEAYQGKYGLIGPIELQSAKKTNNVVEFLEDMVKTIMDSRYDVVEKECTPLQNIIDEILALFYSTLYKLRQNLIDVIVIYLNSKVDLDADFLDLPVEIVDERLGHGHIG